MSDSYIVRILAICLSLFYISACTPIVSRGKDKTEDTDSFYPVIQTVTDAASAYSGTFGPVKKIEFSGTTASVDIPGLTGQNVFLLKVNRSQDTVDYVDTGNAWSSETGGRSAAESAGISRTGTGGSRRMLPVISDISGFFPDGVIRLDHDGARLFNSNPPPVEETAPFRPAFYRAAGDIVDVTSQDFWVEDSGGNWVRITAVLRAGRSNCKVWVAAANFTDTNFGSDRDNKITSEQAGKIADKFDTIYGYTTAIFGYEYGGGIPSGDSAYGGKDHDSAIQILLYDIEGDYSPGQSSGVVGFFWGKDFYDQHYLDESGLAYKTNVSEIFYIDAYFADRYENMVYSTLVHEFQHMIHFNQKYVIHNQNSGTWYNEMLSMLAEDMISPLIGISPGSGGHPVDVRVPTFLSRYNIAGTTEWLSGSGVYYSYANVYAFGAFLARNFGGANLIKVIASNDSVDTRSIGTALKSLAAGTFTSENSAFGEAIGLYAQALVYSGSRKPSGVFTFDKTDSKTIGSTTYTFKSFDIWKINNALAGSPNIPQTYTGPLVWDLHTYWYPMSGNSVLLQSYPEWQGKTGTLTIGFDRPGSPDIDLYIMIR
ncbi:MAG: hypothetical protein LBR47_05660 [Spirochaetaceae bacterium]|jgi:hypothetical protein|nr:hypothetical protein [Spirochaetaceae bacterium]